MTYLPHDKKGRFKEGLHYHPETEFKTGQHWRPRQPFWNKEWLYKEYTHKKRAAEDIAQEFNVTENTILFWLNKHGIQCRKMSEIRAYKKWGVTGEKNGMFGRRGFLNPNWKGGCTPERQSLYASYEWKRIVKKIYQRDNFKCQRCSATKTQDNPLHVHHIISFSIEKLRKVFSNMIILCRDCHTFIHSKKNISGDFIGYL